MKTAAVGLALLLLSGGLASSAPQDPLWEKAVQTQARVSAWMPGTTTVHAQVFNQKGELTDTSETILRTFLGPGGTVKTDVVKSVKNGKEQTEKERQALTDARNKADSRGRSFSAGSDGNPFNPDLQDRVKERDRGETRTIGDQICALFDFTLEGKDGRTFTGIACVDRATGAPVEVSYTLSPLPPGVKSMEIVMRFSGGPAGEGYLKEVQVSGSGSFLFITRSMKSVVTLDDYFKSGGG